MAVNGSGWLSRARPGHGESFIRIPSLGMSVRSRTPLEARGAPAVVEALYASGGGPPLWRRAEAEIFQILTGRYLFEVNGERFIARRGDVVSVPGGAARACVNVTGTGARQQVVVHPGFDAAAFFGELAKVLEQAGQLPGAEGMAVLDGFGERWGLEFLGAPLSPDAALPARAPDLGG